MALHSSKLYRLQQGRRKNNFQICTSGNQQPLPLSPLIDSRRPGHKSKPKFVLCGTQRFSVTLVTHQQWLILVDSLQRMYISSYLHEKEGQIYQISDTARSKRELTTKFSTIFPLLSMAICYIVIYAESHSLLHSLIL